MYSKLTRRPGELDVLPAFLQQAAEGVSLGAGDEANALGLVRGVQTHRQGDLQLLIGQLRMRPGMPTVDRVMARWLMPTS
jgi:hypothetical protein